MISAQLSLEDFEANDVASVQQSPDYLRGFEHGQTAARAESATLQAEAIETLANTLSDMQFGYEEARGFLTAQIAPILSQLADVVLPEVLRDTFAQHLVETIMTAIGEATNEPLQIVVSPSQLRNLQAANLPELKQFEFVERSSLPDEQALILGGPCDVILDTQFLLHELQTALRGLDSPERTTQHG